MPEWKPQPGNVHTLKFHRAFLTVKVGFQDGSWYGRIDGARTYQLTPQCETLDEAKKASIDMLKDLLDEMANELRFGR
jgi:hypothetical protein